MSYISGMPSSPEIIKAMDEISNTVGFMFLNYNLSLLLVVIAVL